MGAKRPTRTRSPLERIIRSPYAFGIFTCLSLYLYEWAFRWLLSGAPILTILLLLTKPPGLQLYPLFTTLHLTYSICSTSILLYVAFATFCYPTIFLLSLNQFSWLSNFTRNFLRRVLKQIHWVDDKVAYFNIPALEIDTEVQGLMVLRGVTFILSEASFWVHGVEVGIKLEEGMELAIAVEKVKVSLFRGIEIGDVFANLKGGKDEMTFATLDEFQGAGNEIMIGHSRNGSEIFIENSALLRAASIDGDRRSIDSISVRLSVDELSRRPTMKEIFEEPDEIAKMTESMTNGSPPENVSVKEGLESMDTISPDHNDATGKYHQTIKFIEETNAIHEARQKIQQLAKKKTSEGGSNFGTQDENAIRAAICSQLHSQPTVPHPPPMAVKVTTLQNMSSPTTKAFMHRLPMLLRLLLNPLAFFHPVKIASITATATGRWINNMLMEKIFQDLPSTSSELRSLHAQISSYLKDANFAFELKDILGLAQVPILPSNDIQASIASTDIIAYRALPSSTTLEQVVRVGGADAAFKVPSFLLPHHEHLIPPPPSTSEKEELAHDIEQADGAPQEIHAIHDLKQAERDETNVKLSVHARLPAVFAQQLLDFIAALVKATKVVEMENNDSVMDEEVKGVRDFASKIKGGFKESVKKVVVDRVVREKWIAWLVGKVVKAAEKAVGEVGYSGNLPVPLMAYRETGWREQEGEKLLP